MNIDEKYRQLKKTLKRINKVVCSKILINKQSNNLPIKQHYNITFLGLKFGNMSRK